MKARQVFLRGYLAILAITIVALVVIPPDQGLAFVIVALVLVACAIALQFDVERHP